MIVEARRQAGWKILRSIPFLGPVRVALILAIVGTPFRFRTKRNLWPYVGLAVVTRSSADQQFHGGKLQRRQKAPLTRGLNRNHNPILKSVFKGAANASTGRPGPLREFYEASLARGVRDELAKVTLARKIVSLTLRLWKKGELWDPKDTTVGESDRVFYLDSIDAWSFLIICSNRLSHRIRSSATRSRCDAPGLEGERTSPISLNDETRVRRASQAMIRRASVLRPLWS